MSLQETFKKVSHHARLAKHKTFNRIRQMHQSDIALVLMILICLGSFPILIRCTLPTQKTQNSAENITVSSEEVHEDLGDAPVVQEKNTSLNELEKRVQLGELKMSLRTLKQGESLITLLSQEGVSAAERIKIIESLELLINMRTLKPGLTFMIFKEGPNVVGLSLTVKENENIAVIKEADASWTPFSHTGRVETKTIRWQGSIQGSFSKSAQNEGVPNSLVNQIISALDGEVDFSTDVHNGTTFDIIAEYKETEGGLEVGSKQLLFIGLQDNKLNINRYAYTSKNGTTSFYTARGKSPAKQIMKRPLKARGRLSSPYGKRRHPILGYEIFHKGVDLAAPLNTPVQAAADGVIQLIGRKGSYGKYISIRHADGYQTAYAHLNGYRGDLKVGSKVKRGEVIGYVGSTGRSTGPHLHFEVIKNKKIVPPFGKNIISAQQLKDFELEQFQSWAESIHPDFKIHLAGKIPPVPPVKPF